ncbi:hypothetical protein ZOD2009_16998 [Haladaptatus paucihalophilus DX253]|uniref:DUF5658 domain-containing protein n=1 Tax=Haladaptatus paucihalophilus DX253 TaxID=797209 RepID=E7QX61_HALPU|nr:MULTISPECIES: hypothetical protein [Haladaptatus]EFW90864.1 hypothetical protein ZOD2009_16998 [Haladaptatus paucihalophilus DX253]ODR79144.1 hypothetical protein BG842_11515 [Haladaptatus sp. W1]SHK24306.1 hypothetical protein SAMN05444342_1080 [Haladaptatus paucihalophilus DX253]
MSNSSVGWLETRGEWPTAAPNRVWLLAILIGGKTLDAVSTITVLHLRADVFESVWLTRTLMEQFGTVGGSFLTLVFAVVGVVVLAESGLLIERLFPESWTPEGYPAAFRTTTYLAAGAWYGFLGVHNFLYLV